MEGFVFLCVLVGEVEVFGYVKDLYGDFVFDEEFGEVGVEVVVGGVVIFVDYYRLIVYL